MEFTRLSIFALFCLALIGTDASQSGENYWQSVWPNTPLPKALSDLLLPYSEMNIPVRAEEEKQYWTVFFEHDLYPGKKMSLGVHKHSDIQRSRVRLPIRKASQRFGARTWQTREEASHPFGARIWVEKESQPSGAHTSETREEASHPFGARIWIEKESQPSGARTSETRKEANHPFGARIWIEKESQPSGARTSETREKTSQLFGARTWETREEASHPFGARIWVEKESQPFGARTSETREEASHPFGARIWIEKEREPSGARTSETREKTSQLFGARTWETREVASHPFGAKIWVEKESQPFGARTSGKKERDGIDDFCGNPSAIGEDKHCASSLESMMDFAISKLGTDIKVISSSFAQNQDEYVVEEVKKIGDKAVMCHRLNFEKVVFYCHQVNATTSYMVPLVASDGTKSKALTICHHDTRGMDPDVLYEVLKVKPGTVPVCHFVGNKAVAWVPKRDVNESNDHPCVI